MAQMASNKTKSTTSFKSATMAAMAVQSMSRKSGSGSFSSSSGSKLRSKILGKVLSIEKFKAYQEGDISKVIKLPHDLAAEGKLEELQYMIMEYSLTLRERDGNGSTLLHAATQANQVHVLEYLIESGMNVEATDDKGNTALHVAVTNGHIEALHLLLNSGASDTILNMDEDAPFHIIARNKNTNLAMAFLQHSVNYVVTGFRQRTPLHVIAEHDNLEVFQVLQQVMANRLSSSGTDCKHSIRLCCKDQDELTPIHLAARKGSYRVLDHMIHFCIKLGYTADTVLSFIDEERSTPLHTAIDGGNLEVVRVLLKHGSDPTTLKEDQPPPLHIACAQGKIQMVEAMVEYCGSKVVHICDQYGRSSLHFSSSAINGDRIIAFLLSNGVDINCQDMRGRTALHNSITSGSLQAARELISQGIDVLAKDNNGLNPLHHAVIHNRKGIVSLLLSLPCAPKLVMDVNDEDECPVHLALNLGYSEMVASMARVVQYQLEYITDSNSNNYFHLAAKMDDWRSLSVLLGIPACQTQLNDINRCGTTPLHTAAYSGSHRCVEILLSHGAVGHKCHKGYTPLLSACAKGHTECAKALFEAFPYQKDWASDDGNSALHMAAISGNPVMVSLALSVGVQVTQNLTGISFFDQIVEDMDTKCAMAVIKHSRWQECLDFHSSANSHPMLGLIEYMPDVCKAVLDRCHTKAPLSREDMHYWEKFDFKYLRLTHEDLEEAMDSDDDESSSPMNYPEDIMIVPNKGTNAALNSIPPMKKEKQCTPLSVLQQMVTNRRIGLLTHPVVKAFLHDKWRRYGQPLFLVTFLVMILQTIFLTVLIAVARKPTGNSTFNASAFDTSAFNASPFSNQEPSITTSVNILRSITAILTTVDLVEFLSTGWQLLRLGTHAFESFSSTPSWFWVHALAVICSYVFLCAPEFIWEAGALAAFFTWFRIAWALQYFGHIGIYMTMFIAITKTVLKVLVVAFFVIFAFALSLHVLLVGLPQFSSIGNSLFTTFGYMLGEVNYDLFILKANSEEYSRSRLSFFVMIALTILLTIVMANLMIGLAVGDIELVRFNATVEKRALEVHYFSRLDPKIPHRFMKKFSQRYYIKCSNSHCRYRAGIMQYFSNFFSTSSVTAPSHNPATMTVEEQESELAQLHQRLDRLSDMMMQVLEVCHQEQIRVARLNHDPPRPNVEKTTVSL